VGAEGLGAVEGACCSVLLCVAVYCSVLQCGGHESWRVQGTSSSADLKLNRDSASCYVCV